MSTLVPDQIVVTKKKKSNRKVITYKSARLDID